MYSAAASSAISRNVKLAPTAAANLKEYRAAQKSDCPRFGGASIPQAPPTEFWSATASARGR